MSWDHFKHEKRQKELAKQQKAEEKRLRRMAKRHEAVSDGLADGEPAWQSSD
jgi:hypothetical protein